MHILIGTTKGLLVYRHSTFLDDPVLVKTHFLGFSVSMAFIDQISGRWWVGVIHKHWGQKLHFSDDQGKNWSITKLPSLKGEKLPNGKLAKVRQIWSMASGGSDQSKNLWLGTDPGALFHSTDNGHTFNLVSSLWKHPSRLKQGQWFGAGSDYPFIHSIVINPEDSNHVFIAISCAGVFETKDGGTTWNPRNNGLIAAYLPNPNVEVGHDPHLLLMSSSNSNILWQQNHCGIFVSKNNAASWENIANKEGIPNYGFTIAIDDDFEGRAWVIPVESDERRIAPNLKLQVYQTDDFGKHWFEVSTGLPKELSFDIVLRQSFYKKSNLMVFGTTSGNVFYTDSTSLTWKSLATHLTKVNCIFIY